jgi:hypothetical protein
MSPGEPGTTFQPTVPAANVAELLRSTAEKINGDYMERAMCMVLVRHRTLQLALQLHNPKCRV